MITVDRDRLTEFCREHRIRALALFGSALRDDVRPDSDVDLLVEFDADTTVTLLDMVSLERKLSGFFQGRAVDLLTPDDVSPYVRAGILASAVTVYEG